MYISPINNTIPKSNFKAKFQKEDIKLFLTEIKDTDLTMVPKLYTLLEFVKNLPGKIAEIIPAKVLPFYQIKVDGKLITNGREYISAFHALHDAVVVHKNSVLESSPIKRMTNDEFMDRFYKNADKTTKDIETFFD